MNPERRNQSGPMNITYIFHSGFLVETGECYYLFDYWKGGLPALNKSKPVFVFASHSHADHYNPEIFSLLRAMGVERIFAVLAKDIPQKRWPEFLFPVAAEELCGAADTAEQIWDRPCFREGIPTLKAYHSKEYSLPCGTQVQTLLSTDSGVAYYVTCPEGSIYHAGDLNDWNGPDTPEQERRQMTGSYRASVNKLKGKAIDIAFLPLDPYLKECYADGFLYFLKNIGAKQVFPMHYWEQPEIVERFLREYPQYEEIVKALSKTNH